MMGGVRRAAAVCIVLGHVLGAWSAEKAPSSLVERVIERDDTMCRVTVFDNGVVVAKRRSGQTSRVRRQRLTGPEFDAYLTLFQNVAAELATDSRRSEAEGPGTIALTLPTLDTMTVRYDPNRPPNLALGRLLEVLDDLERLTLEGRVRNEAVRAWKPQRGDVVELYEGGRARVTRVREDGTVILKHLDQPLVEALNADDLPVRVRRVVEDPQ